MKTIATVLLLAGAVSFTSCAHYGHEGRAHAKSSCCKEDKGKKDCKDGSCKLKGKKKQKSCCN